MDTRDKRTCAPGNSVTDCAKVAALTRRRAEAPDRDAELAGLVGEVLLDAGARETR